MPSDAVATLLKDDFDDLANRLEKDDFPQRMVFKIGAARRARLGVVAFAGGLGAAFAASQFANVVRTVAPSVAETAPAGLFAGTALEVATMLVLACALAATAFVVRQEI